MTENEYTIDELVDFMYNVMDDSDEEAIPLVKEVIQALEEIQQYRAIGTIEEFKALKEKKCKYWNTEYEDCTLNYAEIRNKAIDEAIKTSAEAICVGCGYLDGYKCNYKGCNCGVSKPMLESVVKALGQMKEVRNE